MEGDVYRIEIETVSAALIGDGHLEFGREDAMEQIATLQAVRTSVLTKGPVQLDTKIAALPSLEGVESASVTRTPKRL